MKEGHSNSWGKFFTLERGAWCGVVYSSFHLFITLHLFSNSGQTSTSLDSSKRNCGLALGSSGDLAELLLPKKSKILSLSYTEIYSALPHRLLFPVT